MKCEICHQAEAETAIKMKVDGVEKELYVCHNCAAAKDPKQPRHEKPDNANEPEISVIGSDDNPPPFIKDLVEATIGFVKGVAEAKQNANRTCPGCKSTWDKIKESGRLGCPSCWKTFAKQIQEEFLTEQYGPRHLGEVPAVTSVKAPADQRAILNRALKAAVKREDYHEAARIQRQIEALGPEKEDGEDA